MSHSINMIDLAASGGPDELNASVCVIGSGPSGGIVAAELARAGIDVLVLEVGGKIPDYVSEDKAPRLNISGNTELRFGLSRQLGGSSSLWAGRSAPLEDIDFEPRSWVPSSGWPITREKLDTYYNQAADITGLPGHNHFTDTPSAIEDFLKNGKLEPKTFQWGPTPFNVADYLMACLQQHHNLRIAINAPVKALCENPDGTAIERADVLMPSGKILSVKAKLFVLAAGGLETPHLMLKSTNVRPHGIGNDHDNVGRYFSTHPKADMATLFLKKPVPVNHPMFTDSTVKNGRMRYGLGFKEEAQKRLRLLNHYVQLSPLLEYRASRLFETIKTSNMMNSKLIDNSKLVRGFLPGVGLLAFEAISRLAKLQRRTRIFTLRGFLDQYPHRDNRVFLSNERDALGNNKLGIRWHFTKDDKDSVVTFFRHMDEEFRRLGLGHIEYKRLTNLDDWPLVGLHSHFMGATRMGDDSKISVTDKNGQVFGTGNLFISGPSLFPTYGYANPFYTIVALALRLADHLKKSGERLT